MKKTQTESQLRSAFLLKPWKKSLHPKTHREHYNHKSDAIKASSSYLLRDALVPVRERESYKHPVLGENIFDFERKVEKTENPFAKEALQEKIKEMHRRDGQGERHYYVANDIFGAYNRKKIKAKFPYVFFSRFTKARKDTHTHTQSISRIPGSAIQSYTTRKKWRENEKLKCSNTITERRSMHVERSKYSFRSSLEFLRRDENAREIDRLH